MIQDLRAGAGMIEREGEGGGRGVQDGEHKYTLMADSRQCMAKPIQYCKVINK